MAAATRQLREHDRQKTRILDAARNLLAKDGLEGVSIRKITQAIGYSPTIVYHYYKDKDAVLYALAQEGFTLLMDAVRPVQGEAEGNPEDAFRSMFTRYVNAALGMPDIYRHIMLSSHPDLLSITRVLTPGISSERPAFAALVRLVLALRNPLVSASDVGEDAERVAQIIWTSIFGLILRLLVEKQEDSVLRNNLIRDHLDAMITLSKGFARSAPPV